MSACANYRAALARFGSIYPFPQLSEAAQREIDALRPICERNGIEPGGRAADKVELHSSLDEVLEEQASDELERANRYKEFLREVDDPVVRLVLIRLEEACRYQRLPLLRRAREKWKD
jgi:hypothetical protein